MNDSLQRILTNHRRDGLDWDVYRLAKSRGLNRWTALGVASVAFASCFSIGARRIDLARSAFDWSKKSDEHTSDEYILEYVGQKVACPL